jgi:hypothetical protein
MVVKGPFAARESQSSASIMHAFALGLDCQVMRSAVEYCLGQGINSAAVRPPLRLSSDLVHCVVKSRRDSSVKEECTAPSRRVVKSCMLSSFSYGVFMRVCARHNTCTVSCWCYTSGVITSSHIG